MSCRRASRCQPVGAILLCATLPGEARAAALARRDASVSRVCGCAARCLRDRSRPLAGRVRGRFLCGEFDCRMARCTTNASRKPRSADHPSPHAAPCHHPACAAGRTKPCPASAPFAPGNGQLRAAVGRGRQVRSNYASQLGAAEFVKSAQNSARWHSNVEYTRTLGQRRLLAPASPPTRRAAGPPRSLCRPTRWRAEAP